MNRQRFARFWYNGSHEENDPVAERAVGDGGNCAGVGERETGSGLISIAQVYSGRVARPDKGVLIWRVGWHALKRAW